MAAPDHSQEPPVPDHAPRPLGDLFQRAFLFALRAHDGQARKGTRTPYLSHPLQVAGIALEHGADEQQAAAAVLHDVLEDSPATYDELRAAFGVRIADIVRTCSDTEDHRDKGAWRPRKERYLERLRRADPDAALVAASDKLHNARSLVTDLRMHGPRVLDRFRGGQAGTLWYYAELPGVFGAHVVPEALARELEVTVRTLRELA